MAHAKAFDCQAIDMVYIDFKDIDGLKLNSQQGADMGFTGKQVIHPNNIETVQSVYSPRNEIHGIIKGSDYVSKFESQQC